MEYELYLCHHGVKGMKWGVRKKRYTTVRRAAKDAQAAGKQAAKDKIDEMNASPKKHTLREYNNAARKAQRQAQMDSFRDAKADSKQERALKKASKEYKKYAVETQRDQARVHQKMMIDSYNKTADEYNRYKIAEYNKKNDPNDSDYVERYNKQFAEDWKKNYTKSYVEFTENNKNYQRAKQIADKNGLYDYDELAKANKDAIETMKSYVNGDITFEEAQKRASRYN